MAKIMFKKCTVLPHQCWGFTVTIFGLELVVFEEISRRLFLRSVEMTFEGGFQSSVFSLQFAVFEEI